MKKTHLDNIIINNPVLVRSLGYVSVLAVSKNVKQALVMSLAVVFVMLITNIIVSLLKGFIDEEYESTTLLVIVACFSTIAQLGIQVLFPEVSSSLGIYSSLIALNSIILNGLRTYAIDANIKDSFLNAITNGIGYTLIITFLALIRELLGKGQIFGLTIIPEEYTISLFQEPMMAFILLGILIAISNAYTRKKKLRGIK